MLQRNLVYTGATRGKRLVVLVGHRKSLAITVKGARTQRRWSKLREWLISAGTSSRKGVENLTDIYVDGDACPVREETYRVAARLRLNVFVVSNVLAPHPAARSLEREHGSRRRQRRRGRRLDCGTCLGCRRLRHLRHPARIALPQKEVPASCPLQVSTGRKRISATRLRVAK